MFCLFVFSPFFMFKPSTLIRLFNLKLSCIASSFDVFVVVFILQLVLLIIMIVQYFY